MRTLLLLIIIIFSGSTFGAYNCVVNVKRVLVYGDGNVNILHDGRNDFTYICNTKGTWKNIDTVTCSHWVGLLQGTQNNDTKAIFYYGGNGSCSSLPTYGSAPAPVYIGTVK